uniref:Uncharacterized protein n=1 Tax=Equus asinus TaxID=9793 RepID=A0A9L0JVB3_EQUAS
MGIRLLCVVAFCFPGLGFMDAAVTQTERYLVKRTREKVVMECSQNMGHDSMFWYRQDPALGLQLLHFSYRCWTMNRKEMPLKGTVPLERRRRISP